MALEATHIRFALDIKDLLGVEDETPYVSGAIYPDSRYVSGIDRLATHPKGYEHDHMFRTTDFRKGWFAHLWCDDIQGAVMHERLPETSEGTGEESWLKRSAVKILQDIEDARQFDLAKYLPGLACTENPNGEDISMIQRYNAIFPEMYADIARLDIAKAKDMWLQFGVGAENADAMASHAQEYSQDAAVMTEIRGMYADMLSRARATFPQI